MSQKPPQRTSREFIRVAGRLRELVTVRDEEGNVKHNFLRPVMLEFYGRDLVQVVVGATLLAIPLAFTEEVWTLGLRLPWLNIAAVGSFSLLFIALFVYYNYYQGLLDRHWTQFVKRIVSTYLVSLGVVGVVLLSIDVVNWQLDPATAIKTTVLVSFPASLSAAVVDILK